MAARGVYYMVPCVAIIFYYGFDQIGLFNSSENFTNDIMHTKNKISLYYGPLANDFDYMNQQNNKIECRINNNYVYRSNVFDDNHQETAENDEFYQTAKWIEPLIEFILSHNAKSRKTGSDFCNLYLSKFAWYQYVALQQRMAEHIPHESERPTILLELRTRQNEGNEYAFGIIGGCGQLADAEVLTRIIQIIENDNELSKETKNQISHNMIIKILSAPPPRPYEFVVGNLYQASQRVIHYTQYMEDFLDDNEIEQYMLASNTAHTNLRILQFVSSRHDTNGFQRSFMNIIDSVVHVIKQTLKYQPGLQSNHNILVIGTTQAHKDKIYPKALKRMVMNVLEVDKKEQRLIQRGIDNIKQGNLTEGGDIIVDAVKDKIEKASHVIMGCSEISLAVKDYHIHAIQPDALFIDTTEFMAQSVAAWLVMQNKKYRWIKQHYTVSN